MNQDKNQGLFYYLNEKESNLNLENNFKPYRLSQRKTGTLVLYYVGTWSSGYQRLI